MPQSAKSTRRELEDMMREAYGVKTKTLNYLEIVPGERINPHVLVAAQMD